MSTVQEIFDQIEELSFSDKIAVLADLAKKIQKGANKNVKLSKEEKEAKPKKVMPPNPWNAFIAHKLKESPEMFEGVEKRSQQIQILSAYRKENEDEYTQFVEEFRKLHPKAESAGSDSESVASKKSVSALKEKAPPKPKSNKVEEKVVKSESVADKAAEIKRKLAEKKALKASPIVKPVVDNFDPFANNGSSITISTNKTIKTDSNPFEEESNDLVDKVVKGTTYKYDPKTKELWTQDFQLVGKFNPKLKSQIEEVEAE